MKRGKKIFGKIHLWLGLASGLVIMVVALSGSLLVFRDELEPLLYKKLLVVTEGTQRKPLDELMAIAQQQAPAAKISQVRVYNDPRRSVLMLLGKREDDGNALQVAIDPYTGAILGKEPFNKQFFQVVLRLHRYLLAGSIGKTITGISCLCFTILLVSGMILWWPANKNAIKQRFRVKWDARFKRLNWDLHAVLGFYASAFLLAIALTGLVWSFKWLNNSIYWLADGKLPKPNRVTSKHPAQPQAAGIYQQMLDATNASFTFHGDINMVIPPEKNAAISVSKTNLDAVVHRKISSAFFDNKTGEKIEERPFEKESRGSKIRRMIYPVHTGGLYGWPTKIIALLSALFAASLPVSGVLIWLGKKKKARKQQPAPSPRVAVELVGS